MSDAPDLDRILSEHTNVGPSKPISYLPISTIERLLKMTVADYARLIERAGGSSVVFAETETCIKSGAVYGYSKVDLAYVLVRNASLLAEHSWPQESAEFVTKVAQEWLDEDSPLKRVIDAAFGDHPISVKGVLIHDGSVLLLLNERDEWDLPGGRPEPGEDHRSALKREVQEETGLTVEVGAALDEHLFEVLPTRFVRILPFACQLVSGGTVVLSHEHLEIHWLPLAELGERIAGHALPACYLGAIRQVIDQPRSSSVRAV
jgi:8-oxo-dGTP pyrophosphatase MutT (NUDIX family)